MEWLILFVTSWLLFFLLVDWKELKVNIWSAVLAVANQISVDVQFISHHLYKINRPIVDMWGSSVLFVFGPVVVVGVLLAQYYPKKRWAQITHFFVLAILYSLEELLLLLRGNLVYINWHFTDSLGINFSVIGLLCWFSHVVLKKGGDKKA